MMEFLFTLEIPQWVLEKPSVVVVLASECDIIITGHGEELGLWPPAESLGP